MRDFAGTPASRHSQRCHWLLGRLAGRPSASPYRANHFPRGPLARLAAAGTLAQVHRRPATWSRVLTTTARPRCWALTRLLHGFCDQEAAQAHGEEEAPEAAQAHPSSAPQQEV